ncbi:MAG: ferrous iron transport protein A [Clostridia bacterium]|nr:ferrous iron transport protein A [Clostridia bacterium]
MMPLLFASIGEEYIIKRIGGKPEIKKHLEDIGFVPGGSLTVISRNEDNLIVRVKDSRIAINGEMAQRIIV